jgi:hypothetical protein
MQEAFILGRTISPRYYDELLSTSRNSRTPRWIELDPDDVRNSYNRAGFLVKHRLASHELFDLPPLFALCRRLDPRRVGCRVGKIPIDTEFDSSVPRYNQGLTVDDLAERFEELEGYIVVSNPEFDPQYRPVIEGLLAEIGLQIHSVDPRVTWYATYIFISARGAVTPYHMDREMNFLLQIRGTKTVKLWNPLDDEIMTSEQRDRLLAYDGGRPTYKPTFEAKAAKFDLEPGLGVHHPFIAPHLVHTGPALSVSLAITFRTRTSDIWSNAHRVNQRLRHLGLTPSPVRQHAMVDEAKSALLLAYRQAKSLAHPAREHASA